MYNKVIQLYIYVFFFIFFSLRKVKVAQSCPALWNPINYTVQGILRIPERSLSLLQGIFLTLGSNQGLLHCRQILYQLNKEWETHFSLISYYKIVSVGSFLAVQ